MFAGAFSVRLGIQPVLHVGKEKKPPVVDKLRDPWHQKDPVRFSRSFLEEHERNRLSRASSLRGESIPPASSNISPWRGVVTSWRKNWRMAQSKSMRAIPSAPARMLR